MKAAMKKTVWGDFGKVWSIKIVAFLTLLTSLSALGMVLLQLKSLAMKFKLN